MTTFRVWAPHARRVELVLADEAKAMEPGDGGWWALDRPDLGAGTRYRYRLDGGTPFPDPRSRRQPEGVHGPSEVVDHTRFDWTDHAWTGFHLPTAILYELHVGTFTPEGTFDGAIERLDHLVDLGVTAIELLPVAAFPGRRGWGYDGVDLFAPHEAYGGPDGLKRLVDACHGRGLGVIIDVVYNHLGPDGNYLGQYGPYLTDRYRTPWGDAVNLDDAYADEVRRFIIDNALAWLRDYHLDGLRIDAIHALFDQSAQHLLEQLQESVEDLGAHLGRRLVTLPESDLNDPRLVRPRAAGGYGMAAMWSDDFHHALHSVLTGERHGYYEDFGDIADIARALRHGFVYDGRYSPHRKRRHGRPATGLSGHQLLGYLQNHDQVGNRARGGRIGQLASPARQMIGAALVLTSPFVPMLFQGEEWGASSPFPYFTDHQDPELAEAVRRGRREEFAAFGWQPSQIPDPQAESTFASAVLDWAERDLRPHAELLAWYRQLIRIRRRYASLTDGRLERVSVRFDEGARWLSLGRGEIGVAVNLGSEEQVVPLPSRPRLLLAGSQPSIDAAALADAGVALRADGVAVVELAT